MAEVMEEDTEEVAKAEAEVIRNSENNHVMYAWMNQGLNTPRLFVQISTLQQTKGLIS